LVEIKGCVEILLSKLEVAQLRIPLTKSLRDECDGILIADRLGFALCEAEVREYLTVFSSLTLSV